MLQVLSEIRHVILHKTPEPCSHGSMNTQQYMLMLLLYLPMFKQFWILKKSLKCKIFFLNSHISCASKEQIVADRESLPEVQQASLHCTWH